MKLSTKGRYGLRALIDLATYSEDETVSISSIAARQNISESYLEQLVGKLRRAGPVSYTHLDVYKRQEYKKLEKDLEQSAMDETARAKEADFLRFEIQEIGAAGLSTGEDEKLERSYRRMANSRKRCV